MFWRKAARRWEERYNAAEEKAKELRAEHFRSMAGIAEALGWERRVYPGVRVWESPFGKKIWGELSPTNAPTADDLIATLRGLKGNDIGQEWA